MRIKSNIGFSLIEVVVSMAIFSFIGAGLYSMVVVSNNSWNNHVSGIDSQSQARLAANTLVRDLRVAEAVVIQDEESSLHIFFTLPGIGDMEYYWNNSGEPSGLVRSSPDDSRLVARNVSSLSVADNVDEFLIDMTISVEKLENLQNSDTSNVRIVRKVAKR